MTESEEDHQDEHQDPSRVIKNRDETHASNGDEEDGPAPSSEKGIGDMSSVQLSNWKKVEGGDKEANPSGIPDRMEHHVHILWYLPNDQLLDD